MSAEIYKYLLIDDDEIDLSATEVQAARYPFLQKIASCSQPLEAFELINRFQPDIVFADIEMPGITGVELIRSLAGKVPAPVFITSHPEYALEGYEMDIFDYLLKPISSERFDKCAMRLQEFFSLRNKAFAWEKDQEGGTIVIKQGHEKVSLRMQDIIYLEAMKDYTKILTPTKHYLVLSTLTRLCEMLPAEKFIRVHRSYVVNRDKITAIRGNKIVLDKLELPVGKLYKNNFNSIFQ